MDKTEIYRIWAPADAIWSPWVKPVLFAWAESAPLDSSKTPDISPDDVRYLPEASDRSVVIIELPGALSLLCGLELAKRGFRPVPLYNCIPGPAPQSQMSLGDGKIPVAVDVRAIISLIWHNSAQLKSLNLPVDAPPAFLLDSNRCPTFLAGGDDFFDRSNKFFDNRWLIFSEDFPSTAFLRDRGLSHVTIVRQRRTARLDLRQILLAWREQGLALDLLAFPAREPSSPYIARELSFLNRMILRWSQGGLLGDSKRGFGNTRFRSG
jgi:hypothetical protein